jgi:hypothetical protein
MPKTGWDSFMVDLNALGAAGWELVNFVIRESALGRSMTAVLKRPVEAALAPDPAIAAQRRR